ncbi:MAG TPA: subclass B1 metallo-beta-lactamase [Bacteroidetes bacterium]|nr:subclass B1 metallo-beta-lactamase [Bacteroidota bacterium]
MKRYLFLLTTVWGIIMNVSAQKDGRIRVDEDIFLIPLGDSVYIHETWHETAHTGRFSSNGMIVIRNGEAVMIDTPMDNDKTERMTKYVNEQLGARVALFVAGHFHDDNIGGLEYLHRIGVKSIALDLTVEACRERGLPVPMQAFTDSLHFQFNGEHLVCRFFGPGHSFDNITVWLPQRKILFGGCLIRSADARGLGNLSDAVVEEWDTTVGKILEAYPDVGVVVPGHGEWGGKELLTHTMELVRRHGN